MNKLGLLLYSMMVIRVYKDGDDFGFVWRWWNPLSWILAPLAFIGMVSYYGVPYTLNNTHEVGFKICPYFVENPQQLEWL